MILVVKEEKENDTNCSTMSLLVDPMLVFEFLHRIIDVLTDYLGDISEASIRENFVIVYQVRKKREQQMKGEGGLTFCMVVTRGNDGLWLPFDNRAQRIKGNHHATYYD